MQTQHDNNNGDAVFTVFFKYHSEGAQSVLADPELDALIEKATVTTGDERQKTWQEVFRRVHEDHVADIMMFHMVGYTRVGPRIEFTPDISTNSELQVAKIKSARVAPPPGRRFIPRRPAIISWSWCDPCRVRLSEVSSLWAPRRTNSRVVASGFR